MDDKELDALSARYEHDEDVLELVTQFRFLRHNLAFLYARLQERSAADAAARQSQLKPLAKRHG